MVTSSEGHHKKLVMVGEIPQASHKVRSPRTSVLNYNSNNNDDND